MKSQFASWLLQFLPQGNQLRNQYKILGLSFAIGFVCLSYTTFQFQTFNTNPLLTIVITIIYISIHLFALVSIRKSTVAPWRILGIICISIFPILLTLVVENNINSLFYIAFFFVMFASAHYFGLAYLLSSLSLILMGQLATAAFIGIPDLSLFIIHQLTLSIAPIMAIVMSKQCQPPSFLHENLLNTMNQSPLPMFTYELIDHEPKIRFANTAAYKTFTSDYSDLKGVPSNKLVIAEDANEMDHHCINALSTSPNNQGHRFFIRSHNSEGEIIQFMCVASSLVWLGQSIGVCFLFDITQTEKQRQKMNSSLHEGYMSTLIAGIVHDFRNVLTNIIGTAEVLEFTLTDKTSQQQLQRIIQAGEHGSETITHLLQLSSLNKSEASNLCLDVQGSIQNIIELLRVQIPKYIQLECIVDKGLPSINFNLSELEQILMNLVNNASQAIEKKGKISIHVSSVLEKDSKAHLCISVTDTGCGIKEEDIPLVTKSFWTTRRDQGGRGLGLAMVTRLISQHNGIFDISSNPDLGTTVKICIPALEEPKAVTDTTFNASSTQVRPCTILLVDDSIEILEVYRMLLERMGHSVFIAKSAKEANSIFNDKNINLLMTDMRMPSMDGFELAMTLRKKQPSLPVLMVTAYDKIEASNNLQSLNIPMLLKPATSPKLKQAIFQIQNDNPNIFS